ncbi:MAG: efflux RND transporter periplasmic adaptor subunit [Clostridia bacterium]|nr:efflux RND transporter periplasmic adaptor subunit [Clostridia bacterium]
MKRKRAVAAVILLLVAGAVAVGLVWRSRSKSASRTAVNPYIPIEVRRGDLSSDIYSTGNVQALRATSVYPAKAGMVAEVLVKSGDEVQAGDVLLRLERDELDVQQAESDARQKRDSLRNADDKLVKIRGLYDKGAATATEMKSAQSDAAQAKEALAASQLRLDRLVTKSADSMVCAPVAGVVSSLNSAVGQSVATTSAAAVITEIADVVVRVTVDEYDIGSVQAGQAAQVTFDALGSTAYGGVVGFVSKMGQTKSGVVVYDVDIRLDNAAKEIRPGMSAEASIVVGRVENALIVPNSALETRRGESRVRVYSANGAVEMRQVKTGMQTSAGTEILEGLSMGDTVALANPRASGSSTGASMGSSTGSSNSSRSSGSMRTTGRQSDSAMPSMMPGMPGEMPGGFGGPAGR